MMMMLSFPRGSGANVLPFLVVIWIFPQPSAPPRPTATHFLTHLTDQGYVPSSKGVFDNVKSKRLVHTCFVLSAS